MLTMAKEPKLKPCPLCSASVDLETLIDGLNYEKYRVHCCGCHVKTNWYSLKENIIKAWNRRA